MKQFSPVTNESNIAVSVRLSQKTALDSIYAVAVDVVVTVVVTGAASEGVAVSTAGSAVLF